MIKLQTTTVQLGGQQTFICNIKRLDNVLLAQGRSTVSYHLATQQALQTLQNLLSTAITAAVTQRLIANKTDLLP